jgi:hypothetical protein
MQPLDKNLEKVTSKKIMRAGISTYLKDPKDKAKIKQVGKNLAPTIKAIGEYIAKIQKKLN